VELRQRAAQPEAGEDVDSHKEVENGEEEVDPQQGRQHKEDEDKNDEIAHNAPIA
jgi:hypothetical protein